MDIATVGEPAVTTAAVASPVGEETKAVPLHGPSEPTALEVERHSVAHLPPRTWCRHCVRGRGTAIPRKVGDGLEKMIPTIAIDYMFWGERGGSEENILPN